MFFLHTLANSRYQSFPLPHEPQSKEQWDVGFGKRIASKGNNLTAKKKLSKF